MVLLPFHVYNYTHYKTLFTCRHVYTVQMKNVSQQMPIAHSHLLSMSEDEGRMTSPGGSQWQMNSKPPWHLDHKQHRDGK